MEGPSDREAMPPQEVWKLGPVFIAGGQGEWSLAMRSMVPSSTAAQSWRRLASLRMGGAHLKWVAESGMRSAAKWR